MDLKNWFNTKVKIGDIPPLATKGKLIGIGAGLALASVFVIYASVTAYNHFNSSPPPTNGTLEQQVDGVGHSLPEATLN